MPAPASRRDAGGRGGLAERRPPCGVPNTRSNGPVNAACSSSEKIPPPSLLTTTRQQVGPRLFRPGEQAGRVVQERQVAEQGDGGPAAGPLVGERRPARGRDQAVDAARTPAGQHRDPGPRRHLLIEVADGQAGRGPQQRPVRQRRRQVAGEPGLAESASSASRMAAAARAGRRVRRQPGRQPARRRPAPGPPASRTAAATSVAVRAGSAQRPGPWATTTCRGGAPPGPALFR